MKSDDRSRPRARPSGPWRVAVVEDHLLQRRRTEELVSAEDGLELVHSVETLPDLMRQLGATDRSRFPHVLVLDLLVDRGRDADMRDVGRLVGAGVRVLVLSAMASPPLVAAAIRAGAVGVLGKQDTEEDVLAAVWSAVRGERWITPSLASVMAGHRDRPPLSDQEERALVLYASGLTLEAVAVSLGVKTGTAKKYLVRAKRKYADAGRPIRTKVEMSREVLRDGLMLPEHRPSRMAGPS